MLVPSLRPQMKASDVEKIITKHGLALTQAFIVGIRGYYLNTMGRTGVNDRMIYDDAIFLISPNCFMACNANVDPNGYRPGYGYGEPTKGMANLKEGVWTYQKGIHKTYWAFTQAEQVTVLRDGSPDYEHTGFFGINIHRGGLYGTSSLGCQTIYPTQWDAFKAAAYMEMDEFHQKTITYILEKNTGA